MNRTLADIQAIKVDARDPRNAATPHDRKLSRQDVDLALNTAKDLTVNDGGLFDERHEDRNDPPKLKIDVVDPLDVPRPEGEPLDARLHGVIFDVAANLTQQAAHDLPDIPVAEAAREATRTSAVVTAPEVAEKAEDDVVRRIQVGSFGTLVAAQTAWAQLRDDHPAVGKFKPSYEKVVTGSGKTLVRLKVGPVRDEAQARGLCNALDLRDAWCAKAG